MPLSPAGPNPSEPKSQAFGSGGGFKEGHPDPSLQESLLYKVQLIFHHNSNRSGLSESCKSIQQTKSHKGSETVLSQSQKYHLCTVWLKHSNN